jgi:hypothetical protein
MAEPGIRDQRLAHQAANSAKRTQDLLAMVEREDAVGHDV